MDATDFWRPASAVASVQMSPAERAMLAEVAEILGVSKRTVQRYLANSDLGFPEPAERLSGGRVWRKSDIERWKRAHLPLPKSGRPPKK